MIEGGDYAPRPPADAQQRLPSQMIQEVMPNTPPSKPPPNGFARRKVVTWQREKAQQWLGQRFAGLGPGDFNKHGEVLFYCAARLESPSGFHDKWFIYDNDDEEAFHLEQEHLSRLEEAAACFLLCDFRVPSQVHRLCRISDMLNSLEDSPPIFWMPHSIVQTGGCEFPDDAVLDQVMASGVEDVIDGEPEGVGLVIVCLSKMSKTRMMSKMVNDALNQRLEFNARAQYLRDCVNCIVWDYLRIRLHSDVPPMDCNQPPGLPTHLDGYDVGQQLGNGNFAAVFALVSPDRSQSGEVLKAIDKSNISTLRGLKSVNNQMNIMNRMSRESPHPNIIKFLQAYHTKTHIMFRMEDGGELNLFKRLRMRQQEPQKHALSLAKATSLMSQAIQGVQHLHAVCHLAHRDIKPENTCLKEDGEEITLKVIDFDVAMLVRDGLRSATICGTFPFTAPEVHLQDSYLPVNSDIWSLGVLIAEVLCGAHVIEAHVQISRHLKFYQQECDRVGLKSSDMETVKYLMSKIAERFSEKDSVGMMTERHIRPELRTLVGPVATLLSGMIIADAANRFSGSEVLHLYHNDLGLFSHSE